MKIEKLVRELQAWAAELPGAVVYVREETRLNGAGWASPRHIRPGLDPHPVSAADDGTLAVYIS